ncbi:glycerol-3-phosphate 1-O-acyltransferase PlsY [Mycoplasma buteonis]|uniref:glycerol-3-phosphate 1-O-acyltransferase PlsY n=1 Tax=Mycoplasma buteonis TaxID=171280 RepID=UPI000AFA1336|nr:glycerol-3-phosphate 1-O-acyltransferase PlsY [Mycoplasma buteonis]
MSFLINFFIFILGYLFGSLNTSIILGKLWKKQDVRQFHSNNAGATNSSRVFGKKFGLIVLILDILKGYIAVSVIGFLAFSTLQEKYFLFPLLAGLGCVLGHIFPIFFKFKGGKGVGCNIGILIAINPILFPIAAFFFFSITLISRYVSLGSVLTAFFMIAFVSIPWMNTSTLAFLTPKNIPFWSNTIIFTLSAALLIGSHYQNIIRLFKGAERKINLKRKNKTK